MPPQTTWRSCCIVVDPRAIAYFTQMFIGIGVLVFAGGQLIRLEECPQQQAYLGLFTFVIGLLLPSPNIGGKAANPPVYTPAPTAEISAQQP